MTSSEYGQLDSGHKPASTISCFEVLCEDVVSEEN